MNEVQAKLSELQAKKWTLAAIANEVGVSVNAVEKWKAGDRSPANSKATLMLLDGLLKRKQVPKKRRYVPGSRSNPTVGAKGIS